MNMYYFLLLKFEKQLYGIILLNVIFTFVFSKPYRDNGLVKCLSDLGGVIYNPAFNDLSTLIASFLRFGP